MGCTRSGRGLVVTSRKHIAIIPARGGSRGIPHKNLMPVGGTPLVARTATIALRSGVFTLVVVTTDDHEIARVADQAGAAVVMRPPDLAQDTSPTEPAMAHALRATEESADTRYDFVWLLQCTSPLLNERDVVDARDLLESGTCDAVVGVNEAHPFMWVGDGDWLVAPTYDLAARPRRQDLGPTYHENGALFAVSREHWDRREIRVAGRVAPLVMPAWRSIDVDEPDDLIAVNRLATLMPHRMALADRLSSIRALALDFDGVLTDNRVLVSEDGVEAVWCSRSDGLGISRLRAAGYAVAVFSTERNPVVRQRCDKLELPCRQSLSDKPTAVSLWLDEIGVSSDECVFVGNDLNDLEAMSLVGLSAAPSDSHPAVLTAADIALSRAGGRGAVAELADLLLESRRAEAESTQSIPSA
jgi:YrbI family 3-deoxy-D-manno-octulosonate 8-phosphate phosphatase